MLVGARFDISSVVLVKVVDLVIDIDWSDHATFDLDINDAVTAAIQLAMSIIFMGNTRNFFTHGVECATNYQENDPKDAKNEHSGAKRGHRSPSWQHLLLKFALLQLFYFFLDASVVFG